MGCFWYSRLSKNFRLSVASSVNPTNRILPYLLVLIGFQSLFWRWDLFSWHASTVDSLRVLFLALFCKQEEERSRLSRGPHFLNLRSLRTHWSMSSLSWVSWRFSASSRIRNQGSTFSVSSWEDSVPWLETSLSSLSSYFPAPCWRYKV